MVKKVNNVVPVLVGYGYPTSVIYSSTSKCMWICDDKVTMGFFF